MSDCSYSSTISVMMKPTWITAHIGRAVLLAFFMDLQFHHGVHYIPIQMACFQLTPLGRVCLEIAFECHWLEIREWLAWGQFLAKTFVGPKLQNPASNLMITELFYSHILNINRGSLHIRIFRRMHLSVERCRWTKNVLTGLMIYRVFRETGPRFKNQNSWNFA